MKINTRVRVTEQGSYLGQEGWVRELHRSGKKVIAVGVELDGDADHTDIIFPANKVRSI